MRNMPLPLTIAVRFAPSGERPRLGTLAVRDENFGRIAVPRRAVDDRIAVRAEARRPHLAAPERHAMKDDFGRRRCLHAIGCEVPAAPRRAGDGDDEEQREQNRRNAARHRLRDRRRPRRGANGRGHRRRHRTDRRGRGASRRIGMYPHRRGLRGIGRIRQRARRRHRRHRLEIEGQVARRLESQLAIFLQATARQPLQRRRDVRQRFREIGRIVFQDRAKRFDRRAALECARAGQHLVEDRAEGEDVGARVDRLAAHLLGRHVADRAEDHARLRGRLLEDAAVIGFRTQFRDAEIEDLGAAIARQEDVVRLQIAMDDSLLVRRGQSVRDLQRGIDGAPRWQRTAFQPLAQRHAFEQLADDVRRPTLVADVVNRQQVGMIEHPGRARLLLETLHAFLIAERERGQDFDRDVASEARVFRAIHGTHAAFAEKAHDPIGTEHGVRLEHVF
jgi:hypothetical protein